ncbi:MAG: NAD-dependent epimerase/dehydratase family protein [Caldilineaceae bacterium]|nr:NAD-dependent epimerase/dehydratase family protein [Caldilineaceae bacterium]
MSTSEQGAAAPSTAGKTFLITGGAGFLGINMARYLMERGHKVVSLDIADFDYPERDQVTIHIGDIRNRADVDKAMQGVDIVIHTAAALPLYKPEDIYSTDIDGIRTVLQAAKDAGVERMIHISSTAVYGIPDHHPLLEDDRLDGVGPYGEAKVKAEAICADYRAEGMCVPVIRPKSFIGPERLGVFALFYDWAKDGKNFPMLGSGKNRYQLLDVEDLCAAIYLTATLDRDLVNDVFNIGAEKFTTMKEDYQAVLDYAGHGKRIIPLPAGPAIWALRVLEALHLSPLYKWVYETAATDSFVSIDKAKRVLGWQPKHANKDALVRNYVWYIEHLQEFENKSGVSHRVPWSQGVLKLAKVVFSWP